LKTKQVRPQRRLLGGESAVEGDRISPLESHRQPLEQVRCFPGVFMVLELCATVCLDVALKVMGTVCSTQCLRSCGDVQTPTCTCAGYSTPTCRGPEAARRNCVNAGRNSASGRIPSYLTEDCSTPKRYLTKTCRPVMINLLPSWLSPS